MDDVSPATSPATGPRKPASRDRRGRGMRGPAVLPRVPGQPELRTRRERFDDLALGIVTDIDARWQDRLGLVEYAVEDAPQIPDDWDSGTVPLSSLIRGTGSTPTRLVLFRRPIEHRCETRTDLEAMVLTVVVEQVAELLGIDAEMVDPRYESDD
ncbi:putative Zn-dependent protease with MMP-like domain [Nocardioides ginsengisegetis]|uniref:Putative Zn-dependent protease with MMP-like domain n=1 Tax=Nocardioides ginsengisegetis TaxID=661491 RepID=A0A7W3IXB6_9ACTN|nr:putative Zn-dependent protease with MMP-like domain [Nocardioides ginsengisegetis]